MASETKGTAVVLSGAVLGWAASMAVTVPMVGGSRLIGIPLDIAGFLFVALGCALLIFWAAWRLFTRRIRKFALLPAALLGVSAGFSTYAIYCVIAIPYIYVYYPMNVGLSYALFIAIVIFINALPGIIFAPVTFIIASWTAYPKQQHQPIS